MGFVHFLNHWWNVPFLVLLGLVSVFFVLQLAGWAGGKDVDKELDAGGPQHDVDSEVVHEPGVDHAGADGGGLDAILAFFGVGRVPFLLLWMTLFVGTGLTGLALNRIVYLQAGGSYPAWFFPVALLGGLAVGLGGVAVAARLAGRLVDTGGRGAAAKHELAGLAGVVASAVLDERFGEVRVRDRAGNEQIVHGCLQQGEAPCRRGDRVVLVDYDEGKGLFWVTASPDSDVGSERRAAIAARRVGQGE